MGGADIKKLRSRIKSVDSTLHLTKAMGLVASSKIRRALSAMQYSREYLASLQSVINELTQNPECAKSPYLTKNESDTVRLIVIAGDRGLAGGYNANVFKLAKEFPDADVIPIGFRACDRFAGERLAAEHFTFHNAKEFAKMQCQDFAEGKFGRLGIISTQYNSMMSQEAKLTWVLPLSVSDERSKIGLLFEPDELTMINVMMVEYVGGALYASVKESFASEVAARRVAMDAAGKNAQQMIDDLGLAYNRARQGAITQEITEIVAGSGL